MLAIALLRKLRFSKVTTTVTSNLQELSYACRYGWRLSTRP
jgi:hypothetical protein